MALVTAGCDVVTEKVRFVSKKCEHSVAYQVAEELKDKKTPYNIKILHVTPDIYKNYIEKGKYHIGHLFWETDRLPKSWVTSCNLLDEVWTGTEWNAKVIRDSGVKKPVIVYPQAVNTKLESKRPYLLPKKDVFVFYSIFEWSERKNPKALLQAFWKEFKDDKDVVLLIKTFKGDYSDEGRATIFNDIKRWKNELGFTSYPTVYVCTELLDRDGITRFHATGNCFVSAHRGEGWGLPQAEAAILGKPIISTKIGGIHDYMNGRHYKFVEYDLVPIKQNINKYYEVGMLWAEVKEESLRERMRRMYEIWKTQEKRIMSLQGSLAKRLVIDSFSYAIVGRDMASRLDMINRELGK